MKTITKVLLSGFTALALTACGGSSTGDSTKDDAINKIANYAQNGGEAPTLQDYANAGVTGISNVDEINAFILTLTKEDVDTTEEIQAIANQFGVVIEGNIPPIVLAEASKTTIVEGEVTNLYGHLNSSDPDGEIVEWSWIENGVPFANVPSFTKDDFSVGTHLITLVVTDNDGATSFDNIEITVTAPAPAPAPAPPTCLEAAGYETVTLSNGQVWLDKDLGAPAVGAVGDYYQWGRAADGHQLLSSTTTPTQADSLIPGHGDFITGFTDWTTVDNAGNQRSEDWGTANDPRQVCPCGFVVPNVSDMQAMFNADFSTLDFQGVGGFRDISGNIVNTFWGYYWLSDNPGRAFAITNTGANGGNGNLLPASGASVRCIDPTSRI